jgi:hypothetical protein
MNDWQNACPHCGATQFACEQDRRCCRPCLGPHDHARARYGRARTAALAPIEPVRAALQPLRWLLVLGTVLTLALGVALLALGAWAAWESLR